MIIVLNSFFLVVFSEFGDKTQLLALVLATRFRRPWTIMAGILVATILNHWIAATVGSWVSHTIPTDYLKWILAITFWVFALWILIPDKDTSTEASHRFGAFMTSLITFFLAEMGDKTQLATVALAAKFQSVALVTVGTTLGMLVADGAAVFLGEKLTRRVSMKWIRYAASALFVLFGIAILLDGFANF